MNEEKQQFQRTNHNYRTLAKLYKVSRPTIKKWIKPILDKLQAPAHSRIFTPVQCARIFEFLGDPEVNNEKLKTNN